MQQPWNNYDAKKISTDANDPSFKDDQELVALRINKSNTRNEESVHEMREDDTSIEYTGVDSKLQEANVKAST
jgi:hypothetical protein